jgi:alkylation response protein AidB-like acyl-CoA dehydrogenase
MYTELDTELTPEEVALKTEVHRFAAEVLRPASLELDALPDPDKVIAADSPYWDVFRKYYELGYHRSSLPDAAGGTPLSPRGRHIVCEEMGWGSADFAVGLGVASFPYSFAAMSGRPALLKAVAEFVEDTKATNIGCWAITEPEHGSDLLMVGTPQFRDRSTAGVTRARRNGDDWVIAGQKSAWVSNGTVATHALAFITAAPERGPAAGVVAFIPLTGDGVSRGKPLNKLGQRALNQGEIFFDDVHLHGDYIVVPEEAYPYVLDSVLSGANSFMGATFTGLARAAFEEALDYARARVQGGKPIAEHQAIQLKLIDMFTKVECARALSRKSMVYNAITTPPSTQHSMASKVFCTQASFEVASDALQVFGGYGLARGMLVEKLIRDARAALIEDGTNEVLSLAAARKVIDDYTTESTHRFNRSLAVGH